MAAHAIDIEGGSPQLRRQHQSYGPCAVCAYTALVATVAVVAFRVGAAHPSQAQLFMTPPSFTPQRAPVMPQNTVVTDLELLRGMRPIRSRANGPTLNAQLDNEGDDQALAKYNACKTYCCRRDAISAAVGAAAVMFGSPALAAPKAAVQAGDDVGNLKFIPAEVKICKGDTVLWTSGKAGPHNVVFDEGGVPAGVDAEDISKAEYFSNEGDTWEQTFEVAGTYSYYCVPHRGAGMQGKIIVSG